MRKGTDYTLGIQTNLGILDVQAVARHFGLKIAGSMMELIQDAGTNIKLVEQLVRKAEASENKDFFLAEEDINYGPCVTNPEKILCVGLNYRKHTLETNLSFPENPIIFSKFNNALAGHRDIITPPKVAKQIDYEAELVIVIGKEAREVTEKDALSCVFGYCAGNDLSARDLQPLQGQWLLGKTCDGFAPVGPWLVTADEIPQPDNLEIQCQVNEDIRQASNTRYMIFSCAQLISYISWSMTLKPGDLIFTGTPEGVIMGYPEAKQVWLKAGDEVQVAVEKLGKLKITIG
ncbi:MAG: fumarylacetoacetate hydrolase family protein [Desulfitobacteriaceae bacterium]|nr:fumarylacetoacetate hydrolase family protein [Desulfitobacteriaceae bacterium]MDD4346922.1 fumarylacetoacetate hydrolase family protein [Desulfitobacteriaceae bacterium]MDD4401950.1 fumarylacetoacetate hydrolase family protein [Desulfitobacteriaceae bacterium]